jgi:hypothetical protein
MDYDMKACFDEMKILQEKMENLEKKKKEREELEKNKKIRLDTNYIFYENWLEKWNIREVCRKFDSIRGNYTELERVDIRKDYDILMQNYKEHYQKHPKTEELMPTETYLRMGPPGLNKDFVEATYNLFKIQERKIQKLEIAVKTYIEMDDYDDASSE